MEVLEASSELLSDREVMEILKKNSNSIGRKKTNLATILYETTSYLSSGPAASSSMTGLAEFLTKVKERKYNLTKMEKIQITNLMPQNETELQLIVDNLDEKLTPEQQNDLLELIQKTLQGKSEEIDQSDTIRKKLKQ